MKELIALRLTFDVRCFVEDENKKSVNHKNRAKKKKLKMKINKKSLKTSKAWWSEKSFVVINKWEKKNCLSFSPQIRMNTNEASKNNSEVRKLAEEYRFQLFRCLLSFQSPEISLGFDLWFLPSKDFILLLQPPFLIGVLMKLFNRPFDLRPSSSK